MNPPLTRSEKIGVGVGAIIVLALIILILAIVFTVRHKPTAPAVKAETNVVSSIENNVSSQPVEIKKLAAEQKRNEAQRRKIAELERKIAILEKASATTSSNSVTFKSDGTNITIRTSALGGNFGTYAGSVSGSNNCNIYIINTDNGNDEPTYVWTPRDPRRPCLPDRPPPGKGKIIIPDNCWPNQAPQPPPPAPQPQSFVAPAPVFNAVPIRAPEGPSAYYVNPGYMGHGNGPGSQCFY